MRDQPDPPGRARRTLARTGWVLVVGAALALAAALTPLLVWSHADGESLWARSLPAAIAVLVLGPATSLAAAVAWARAPADRGVAVLPALAAGVTGWIAWVQLSGVTDRHLGPGGPVAVLATAALVVGWVLVATGWPAGALTGGGGVLPWLVAAAVLGLLVTAAVPAVEWYRTGRLIDHTTAGPLPEAPAAGPADLARQRWRVPAPDAQLVGTAGRYAVLRRTAAGAEQVDTGVRVVDGATGAEHWRYLRTDLRAEAAVLSGDGALVVVLFTAYDERRLLALETATGQVRWQRNLPPELPTENVFRLDLLVAGDAVVLTTQCGLDARQLIRNELLDYRCQEDAGSVYALDARTGADRWQWAPAPMPREPDADGPAAAPCFGVAAAPAGDTLVVQLECPTAYFDGGFDPWFGPALQEFVGLNPADGTERWRREPPELAGHLLGPRGHPPQEEEVPVLRPLGEAVLAPIAGAYQTPDGSVTDLAPRWVTLSGVDGTELSTVETGGEPIAGTGELAIYVEGHAPAEAVAVDPTTGEPRWRSRLPRSGPTSMQTLAVISGQAGYLLRFQGERFGDQLRSSSGEVTIVTVDLAGGAVTEAGSHELADLVCPRDPCLGLAGGGLVLVTAPPGEPGQAELVSLG